MLRYAPSWKTSVVPSGERKAPEEKAGAEGARAEYVAVFCPRPQVIQDSRQSAVQTRALQCAPRVLAAILRGYSGGCEGLHALRALCEREGWAGEGRELRLALAESQ